REDLQSCLRPRQIRRVRHELPEPSTACPQVQAPSCIAFRRAKNQIQGCERETASSRCACGRYEVGRRLGNRPEISVSSPTPSGSPRASSLASRECHRAALLLARMECRRGPTVVPEALKTPAGGSCGA